MKQYASVFFPAPELIGLLMDLNVAKSGFQHVSEFMTRRGAAYTAATGLPFPRPIPSRDRFTDTWKELVKPRSTRVRAGAPYKRPLLAATSDRAHPLWTPSIGPGRSLSSSAGTRAALEVGPNYPSGFSTTGHRPAHPPTYGRLGWPYAGIRTICSNNLQAYGRFF